MIDNSNSEDRFNVTLVRSKLSHRPYTKIDNKYRGPTWINDIGLQTVSRTIEAVYELAQRLQHASSTCMVMGTARQPVLHNVNRTLKNFIEEPIYLLVLDLDKYEGKNIKEKGHDITHYEAVQDAEAFIRQWLPPEFHDTSFVLRFSGSFLYKEKADYLRCHILFLLEDPQYPREIGMWIKQDRIPVDATWYFNLTQPIFTAAPIWQNEQDPLATRKSRLPRVSLIRRIIDCVAPGWQP